MYTIEDYLPHRDRMKLIDEIVEIDMTHCVTRSVVTPEWPLFRDGKVNSIIIVELVAQTASIFVGWHKRQQQKSGGKGFIVGIKKVDFSAPSIPVGSSILTTCRMLVNLDDNYGEFEGEARVDKTGYGRVHIQTVSADAYTADKGNPGV